MGSVLNTIQTTLSPAVLLVVATLAVVFFIFGLLNLLLQNGLRLRRSRRRVGVGDDGAASSSPATALQELFHLHDAGVDQAFIDALPVFVYRAVGGGGGDPFDCAVCLCEFAMDDKLRLLPTCGHAFHVPCIDAWLLSHSTCPLCRGSVVLAPPPPSSSSEWDGEAAALGGGGRDDGEGSPKAGEEVVRVVKLGKLRCVDGNGGSGELEATSGNLGGQRRSLSMGSYEYVMDDHAALRIAINTPKESSPSRRLNKDSFSVSKIWMVAAGTKEGGGTAELTGDCRRSVSFRWPAMAELTNKNHAAGPHEEHRDVEAGSFTDNGGAEETPPFARTTPLWAAGGWQQPKKNSSSSGSHC